MKNLRGILIFLLLITLSFLLVRENVQSMKNESESETGDTFSEIIEKFNPASKSPPKQVTKVEINITLTTNWSEPILLKMDDGRYCTLSFTKPPIIMNVMSDKGEIFTLNGLSKTYKDHSNFPNLKWTKMRIDPQYATKTGMDKFQFSIEMVPTP
jgi:hypothetical protein